MNRNYERIAVEAAEYGIAISNGGGVLAPVRFYREGDVGNVLAWMQRTKTGWKGYVCEDIRRILISQGTPTTYAGRKGNVANWCLDYAVNGA